MVCGPEDDLGDQGREQPDSPGASAGQSDQHPLGPLVWRERLQRPALGRLVALALFAACASGLVMAAWLDPDAPAYGTHRTLGLGPCGFLVRTGFPCPTCGMTTSCCLTVRGRLGAAFYAQPLGPFLVLAAALGGLGCLVVAATGQTWMVNWYRISPLLVVWIVGLAFILAWGIKIAVGLLDGSLPARSF